jgi:two-component system, cell cycle response regulator
MPSSPRPRVGTRARACGNSWRRRRECEKFISPARTRVRAGVCQGGILLWGIGTAAGTKRITEAKMLWEHAQVCLLNLEKFEEVKQRTFIDDLTGLYNSRYLKHALTNAIVRSSQNARHFAVLFIDVDHFKSINDKHGHMVGSAFLVAIAKAVRNCVRNIDPVFRYGGDEFVVILHDTNKEGAREIGERIRRQIERRVFVLQDVKIQTTVSVGIAVYPDHTMERDTLLRLADSAMYSVKRDSRNAVHMAFPDPVPTAKKPPELQ